MPRLVLLLLALTAISSRADTEFGPALTIESPDTATTYAFGSLKHRALIWSDKAQMLYADVTFEDESPTSQTPDDTHRFRLPGITFDKAKGIFYGTTSKGEVIPIAQKKKGFLLSTIEVLPNAIVRVHHHHGNVEVELEAIRPDDLARAEKDQATSGTTTNPDGSHTVNLENLLP